MNFTQGVVILAIGLLLGYDGAAPSIGNPTESQVLRNWGRNWALLPFCGGFLLGHWFMNLEHPFTRAWGYAIPILAALLIWDTYLNLTGQADKRVWYRFPGLWACLGIPAGALLWGQAV